MAVFPLRKDGENAKSAKNAYLCEPMYEILNHIQSPEDLRKLPQTQLQQLCEEVRKYMVECCAVNPGHLGSSLGAVELIVALHYIYDTPKDKLIFDVGHQAYAHTILTGRRELFKKNRTLEGISGFPNARRAPTMPSAPGIPPRPYRLPWALPKRPA